MHAAFDGEPDRRRRRRVHVRLPVPGGSLPCAGVTVVGVYPTHRRRGALAGDDGRATRDVHERGEPIAALWASEETIYGRFGYGIASWGAEMKLPRNWNAFAQPLERAGQVRFVSAEEASSCSRRSGTAAASSAGVPSRSRRRGGRCACSASAGGEVERRAVRRARARRRVEAYAIYAAPFRGRSRGASSTSRRRRATPQATAEIWRYLSNRLDGDDRGRPAPARPPALPPARNPRRARFRAATRCGCGSSTSARRCRDGSTRATADRLRGARRGVPVERGALGARRRPRRADGGRCGHRARRRRPRLGVPRRGLLRGAADAFALEELQPGAVERADALFAWRPLPWCPEIF